MSRRLLVIHIQHDRQPTDNGAHESRRLKLGFVATRRVASVARRAREAAFAAAPSPPGSGSELGALAVRTRNARQLRPRASAAVADGPSASRRALTSVPWSVGGLSASSGSPPFPRAAMEAACQANRCASPQPGCARHPACSAGMARRTRWAAGALCRRCQALCIVFFPWKRTSNSWLTNISGPSSHLTPEKSAVHRQVVPSVAPWQPAPQRLAEDDAPALNAGMFTCVPSSSSLLSVNDACLCAASCFVE